MTRTPADPCFFVLGYGRSGTTLLRRMLSAHPNLFVAPENDVFQRLPSRIGSQLRDDAELRDLVAGFPPYYRRIYDLDQFVRDAAARLPLDVPSTAVLLQGASLIGQHKTTAQWGHKAPSEWPYLPTMRAWFPNARFLHLVRHPHDSTASMNEYQLQRYRTTPLVSIWQWRKAFRAIRRHGQELGPERYLMLRYEELVADPHATLDRASHFLGVSTEHTARMVDFHSDPSAAHVDEGVHMERTQSEVTATRIGRAELSYSAGQAAMLDHVCRDELRELGYQHRAPRPVNAAKGAAYDAACRGLDVAWAGLRAARRARGQL